MKEEKAWGHRLDTAMMKGPLESYLQRSGRSD